MGRFGGGCQPLMAPPRPAPRRKERWKSRKAQSRGWRSHEGADPEGLKPYGGSSPVEPEAQHVLELAADVRVVPVEVGLLGGEQVEIPLTRLTVCLLGARPGG